jgi:tetratricopeptide (TPR) repeat protein
MDEKKVETDPLFLVIKSLTSDERRKTAVILLDEMFKLAKTVQQFESVGRAALEVKYAELYLKCAEICYSMMRTSEQLYIARENLYKAYNLNNYPEKALFYIDLNLQVTPDDPDTLAQKAFNLSLMGDRKGAEAIIESLIARKVKLDKEGSLDYALCGKYLRMGQTAKGIDLFINTFKKKNHLFEDALKLKFWNGGAYPGKTIVINGEGGIGDELINIRFLDNLKQLGMNPILYSSWHMYRPDMVGLFKRHGYEVTTNHLFFPKDALWTHMMSLPGYLDLKEEQLWTGSYLKPLRQEKNKLESKKFKIGIKANGNPHFEQDVYRRIPFDQLMGVMPEDVEVYYIDTEREYEGTISLKNRIQSWEDTLDFIDQMDMIVSSCTSLVHAAGAMGKRTIVCVPIAEYYIWTSTRTNETTPWYGDNFTVLKQTKLRSWDEPLARARELILEEMNAN